VIDKPINGHLKFLIVVFAGVDFGNPEYSALIW